MAKLELEMLPALSRSEPAATEHYLRFGKAVSASRATFWSALYEAAMAARSTEPHSVERRKRGPRR